MNSYKVENEHSSEYKTCEHVQDPINLYEGLRRASNECNTGKHVQDMKPLNIAISDDTKL